MNMLAMNEQALIDSLAASCADKVPGRADVLVLRGLSQDEARTRANRFVSLLRESDACSRDHANFVTGAERTVVRLTGGARATLHHASGALQFSSGLAPLEGAFARVAEREVLTRQLQALAQQLKLREWAGDGDTVDFERLWLSKAQGADREQRLSEPVLLRATGAWRHAIDGVPVLGAASVALTLAGEGAIDALSIRMRPGVAETLDSTVVLAPEDGAREIARRLASILGNARERLPADAIHVHPMRFGYLDLGKRKAQRVLAPVYVAQVEIRHKLERQGYVFAVPATERVYQELPLFGTDQLAGRARLDAGGHCRDELR